MLYEWNPRNGSLIMKVWWQIRLVEKRKGTLYSFRLPNKYRRKEVLLIGCRVFKEGGGLFFRNKNFIFWIFTETIFCEFSMCICPPWSSFQVKNIKFKVGIFVLTIQSYYTKREKKEELEIAKTGSCINPLLASL